MNRILFLSSLIAACQRDPKGGVDIIDGTDGPEIAILNCSDSTHPPLALRSIEIRQIKGTAAGELECFVSVKVTNAVVTRWTYGTPISDYSTRGCGALQPGTYEVGVVLARNTGAKAVFSIDANGHVLRQSGGCD